MSLSFRWGGVQCESSSRVHHRVANLRMDALHKLTTTITTEYGTVVIEDLNVAETPWSLPQDPRHPSRPQGRAGAGRAGGATLPRQRRKETGDRHQDTTAQLALW
ncbi:transposase [Kitasatospora sp. NPDC101155]|uniref:transposase n=1 Tax=Kitasatospora sp. NPDC101155 TaxID=3364097 RepID=UPI00380102AB